MTLLSFSPVILLFTLFALRVPIAVALLMATAVYFGFVNTFMPKETMIQTMVASMESFPYLAIPFFTCAGVVFNYAGITSRLPNCCSGTCAAAWHRSTSRCRR